MNTEQIFSPQELLQQKLLLENEVSFLNEKIKTLEEKLNWFQRQIFGKRSEKYIHNENQPLLPGFEFPVSQESKEPKKQVAAHERKTPNRNGKDKISWPSDLPVVTTFIDLPEEEKICKETGCSLIKIGEEKSSKLAQKPGSFYIKEVIRPKYGHPKKSEEGIKIANLPESLLTRCQADDTLLADILVKKFGDHLPLYRISEIFGRQNIFISKQTLSEWVLRCGEAFLPLYNEIYKQIIASGNVFIDETPIEMLSPGKGKTHQAFMWVMCGGKESNPPYRFFNFRTSRKHLHASELLKDYTGILHSDKYGAYESLANSKQFTWCPCWVHIRRKFIEAEYGDPVLREWILLKIQSLFKIEEEAWLLSPEDRTLKRQIEEIPIINELIQVIKDKLINSNISFKSKFKEALGYFCGLIPYLKNYATSPWARLDNNVAERAVRPLAIGRKNWLFVGNEEGGRAAAVCLSLIQTCRNLDINPRDYLENVMGRLMSHNSQKLYELLPDQWMRNPK